MPDPPSKAIAFDGGEKIDVYGLYHGAAVRIFRQSTNDELVDGIAIDDGNWFNSSQTVEKTWKLTGEQELCSVSDKLEDIEIVPRDEYQQMLSDLKVVEPVCPGARYVDVRIAQTGGRVYLYKNDNRASNNANIVGYAGASQDPATVGIFGTLQHGDQLVAKQSTSQVEGNPSAVITVDSSAPAVLDVKGKTSHTSQNDGTTVTGFVSESSRGPFFELRDCCPNEPVTENGELLLEIYRSDLADPYATVTLKRQYWGVYTGRWDWYAVETQQQIPPPANYEYTAVVTSPCSGEKLEAPINVLTGTANNSGDQEPLDVSLKVEGTEVSQGDTSQPLSVSVDEHISLSAKAYDRDGVQALEILANPSSPLNAPKAKTANESVPIPDQLTLNTDLDAICPGPGTNVEVYARAKNFGSSTWVETGRVEIDVQQETPEITSVSPTEVYSDDTIDISGDYLYYDCLTTTVEFCPEGVPSGDSSCTTVPVDASDSDEDQLSNVSLSGLSGKFGKFDVRVKVGAKTSLDMKTITVKDRSGPFKKYGESDFDLLNSNCSSSQGSGDGRVTGVTITEGSSSGQATQWNASFASDGRSNYQFGFSTFTTGSGTRELGGVILASDGDCRLALILNHTHTEQAAAGPIPRFDLHLLYFPKTGSVQPRTISGVDLTYVGTGGYVNYVTQVFAAHVSMEGSVVAAAYPFSDGSSINGYDEIPMSGAIYDMLSSDELVDAQSNSCATINSCDSAASLSGSNAVELKLNGSSWVGPWTLP